VGALPVVIHLPDFFVPAPGCNVENMRLSDARDPTAQAGNDLVSKAMRDQACIVLAAGLVVLLAENLRRIGILRVEEPAVHCQAAASSRKVIQRRQTLHSREPRPTGQGSSVGAKPA